MESSIVEFQNVFKAYALGRTTVEAVRGVSFQLRRGAFVGVVGPSGSGKTTLLNLMGLIDVPTSGKVLVDGRDIGGLRDRALTRLRLEYIGFIFQNFNLIPVLNAVENVEFPLLLQGKLSKRDMRRRALEVLDSVGLTRQQQQKPSELSGGQRQRVAIARALVGEPALILADEPTANLDSETGKKILELMKSMNEQRQTTFVLCTHDLEAIEYTQERISLRDGRRV